MSNIVTLGYEYFPDPTKGRPVFNGSIYIGEPDTDPTIPANQKSISVRQENGTLVPVSQPVMTGAGGVPIYNGSPVGIEVAGEYSLAVLNNQGVQVYYLASGNSAIDASTLGGNLPSYYLPASSYTADDVLDKLKTVDGSGSGLDADTVGGIQGANLLVNNAPPLFTNINNLSNSAYIIKWNKDTIGKPDNGLSNQYGTGLQLAYDGGSATQIVNDFYSDSLFYRKLDLNSDTGNWNKVWSSSNDGAGSGLDADTVDGKHASELGGIYELIEDWTTTAVSSKDFFIDPTKYVAAKIVISGVTMTTDAADVHVRFGYNNGASIFTGTSDYARTSFAAGSTPLTSTTSSSLLLNLNGVGSAANEGMSGVFDIAGVGNSVVSVPCLNGQLSYQDIAGTPSSTVTFGRANSTGFNGKQIDTIRIYPSSGTFEATGGSIKVYGVKL